MLNPNFLTPEPKVPNPPNQHLNPRPYHSTLPKDLPIYRVQPLRILGTGIGDGTEIT